MGKLLTIKYGKDHKKVADGHYPIYGSGGVMRYGNEYLYDSESILIPRKGTLNNIFYINEPFWTVDTMFWSIPNKELVNVKFLYYQLLLTNFAGLNVGSAVPSMTTKVLNELEVALPSLEEQRRIAGILGSLDDKIELNNRINKNLEEQASALFKRWFVDFEFPDTDGKPNKSAGGKFIDSPLGAIPEGWRVDSLVEIASYLNGLAMQKFRPLDGEVGIPVLKIKELGQRECNTSSDLCSPSIKNEYIINNGDVIFSWSGTLMIDIWCGGLCGLNQHLFKVTSGKYPKWFYYMWTNEHQQEFIRIAKDKAVTIGHIKREHLVKSQVLIPKEDTLSLMTNIMSPMFEDMINRRVENRKLTELRDTLLPKLMNNEINL